MLLSKRIVSPPPPRKKFRLLESKVTDELWVRGQRFSSRFHGAGASLHGAVFRRVFIAEGAAEWINRRQNGGEGRSLKWRERWHNVLRGRTGLIRKCLTLVKSVPGRRTRWPAINASSNTVLRGRLRVFQRILESPCPPTPPPTPPGKRTLLRLPSSFLPPSLSLSLFAFSLSCT